MPLVTTSFCWVSKSPMLATLTRAQAIVELDRIVQWILRAAVLCLVKRLTSVNSLTNSLACSSPGDDSLACASGLYCSSNAFLEGGDLGFQVASSGDRFDGRRAEFGCCGRTCRRRPISRVGRSLRRLRPCWSLGTASNRIAEGVHVQFTHPTYNRPVDLFHDRWPTVNEPRVKLHE